MLRRGDDRRGIPYASSSRGRRSSRRSQPPRCSSSSGDTRTGVSRASVYRYPAAAFGPAPTTPAPPMNEDGARAPLPDPPRRARRQLRRRRDRRRRRGSLVHPWVLGSKDENDVQGYAGTPVNVNPLTFDYPLDVGAAGASSRGTKAYYVSVDSGRDQFTGRSLGGAYVLRAWVDDVSPPLLGLITTRVSAGRPTLVAARDRSRRRGRRPALARDRATAARSSARRSTTRSPASRSSRSRRQAPRLRAGQADAVGCRPPTSRRRRTSTRSATTSCRTRPSPPARSRS